MISWSSKIDPGNRTSSQYDQILRNLMPKQIQDSLHKLKEFEEFDSKAWSEQLLQCGPTWKHDVYIIFELLFWKTVDNIVTI